MLCFKLNLNLVRSPRKIIRDKKVCKISLRDGEFIQIDFTMSLTPSVGWAGVYQCQSKRLEGNQFSAEIPIVTEVRTSAKLYTYYNKIILPQVI